MELHTNKAIHIIRFFLQTLIILYHVDFLCTVADILMESFYNQESVYIILSGKITELH